MRVSLQVTEHYFRALAKVAFHYYLLHSRRGLTGGEPNFGPIRRFITEGGDQEPFFRGAAPIRSPFGHAGSCMVLPSRWCHLLAVDESGPDIYAMVQLCVGPEFAAPAYNIALGRSPGGILIPGATAAHGYVYGADSDERYAGNVVTLSLPGQADDPVSMPSTLARP
jgi:hypothetical protein